ncbi:MAG: hypothetical protein ACREPH_13445 [Rhodanobacteraceae bacterium]
MSKVTVYRFKVWDVSKDEYIISPRAAPMDLIKRQRWQPLMKIAIEVESSALDHDGMYWPNAEALGEANV